MVMFSNDEDEPLPEQKKRQRTMPMFFLPQMPLEGIRKTKYWLGETSQTTQPVASSSSRQSCAQIATNPEASRQDPAQEMDEVSVVPDLDLYREPPQPSTPLPIDIDEYLVRAESDGSSHPPTPI